MVYNMNMIHRALSMQLLAALTDSPVVFVNGARQTGKSTLVQWIAGDKHPARYLTLDDAAVLTAAGRDPAAFLDGLDGPVVIDEVQLAPDLFRAVKLEVDRDRTPGRFLLTGSANVLLLPHLSESLAGRMEILTLWPFSAGELEGTHESFIDDVFSPAGPAVPQRSKADTRAALFERILTGGYPEVTQRPSPDRRRAWFGSYLTTILQRDIRQMADIEGLMLLPRVLALLAAQCGGVINVASLSRDTGISQPTLKRYLTLLEAAFLVQPLRAWSGNTSKRLTRKPKVFLNDTGLMAYLLGIDSVDAMDRTTLGGALLESFVAQELRKQIGPSRTRPEMFYYRTTTGREVDFVLEDRRGQLVGIEVKAAATIRPRDLTGMTDFSQAVGKRFARGIILYTGHQSVAFAANLHANSFADSTRARRCYEILIERYPEDDWADFAREQVRMMV